jgi:two-component system NarL family sensor kinase
MDEQMYDDSEDEEMKQKPAQLPWFITGASGVLTVSGLALWALAIVRADVLIGLPSHQLTTPISGLTFAALGGLVLSRHPRHPIGWMLAGLGLISGVEVLNLGFLTYRSLLAPGEVIAAPDLSHWLAQWIWSPRSNVSLTLLLLLFPDGRLPSRQWRWFAWALGFAIVMATLASAFTPSSWDGLGGIVRNPYGVESAGLGAIVVVSGVLLLVGYLGCMVSVLVRFRHADGPLRQQLKWMAYAVGMVVLLGLAAAAIVAFVPDGRLGAELAFSIVNIASICIAAAAAVAILRHRLYDIDLLIHRTLVYGTLTLLVIGAYVVLVGSMGALFQSRGSLVISLIATGVIAVLFQPAREWLQTRVNKLLYGERDQPYEVLSRLGRRLEVAAAPEATLNTIVQTIAQNLKLPYVALALPRRGGEEIAAETGRSNGLEVKLPLYAQRERVGHLICAPRASTEPFTERERRLLRDIANQAAVAVRAAELSSALQASRQRLITAREEERRRLRRDLHDGLGPQLASMALKIDAARNQLATGPQAPDLILKELRGQVKDAIADIRRLVYNLRPPALDELGLLPALRATAASQFSAGRPRVRVEGPHQLPALPAAVEVAAYRIAQEAVTNVARHANARHCLVRLSLQDGLQLEIEDDGDGLPEGFQAGVGLNSMQERTLELGGRLVIQAGSNGGTRVLALFPLTGPLS